MNKLLGGTQGRLMTFLDTSQEAWTWILHERTHVFQGTFKT